MKNTKVKVALATAAGALAIACGSLAFASEPAATVTADDIQTYCGMCHFTNIENASINSWNKTSIDAAMVESMMPSLDDETIDAIASYFAQIEPAEQEAGQQG